MGQHSDRAREALLDAAEELFAMQGIDAVSNRRITEHAGTANHSAIKYHFGGRDEMMSALLSRYSEQMAVRRAVLVAGLDEKPALRDVVACMILPWVEQLDALPRPSWRARFLFQVRSVPSVASALAAAIVVDTDMEGLLRRQNRDLGEIPVEIVRARSGILGQVVLGICSEYEAQLQEGAERGTWTSVGYFLIDSIAGMLSAPVTHSVDFLTPPTG